MTQATPMPPAPTLVVLLAPPGPLAGLRDALTDWSALGLVAPFLWVEGAEAGLGGTPGTQIVSGRADLVWLEQGLAQRRYGRIRVCVLVPALAGVEAVSPDLEDKIARLVQASSGAAAVDRLRCTVYRPRSGPGVGQPAREGWHNLVLSPEDAQGPGLGHWILEPSVDAIDIGAYAAATVCGLTGLWAQVDAAPLDDVPPLPGRTVRVVRAFYRKLDAQEVEERVREGVTSMAEGLPRPRQGNARSEYLPDLDSAARQLAQRFWERHAGVLNSGREELPRAAVPPIGAREALSMFFRFLVATIANAPGHWYATVIHRASLEAASRLQRALFGTTPAAAVVVNGVRADGEPLDWQDLSVASTQLSEVVRAEGVIVQPGADQLADVWREYVWTALTLADAGERVPGLGPVETGLNRAVARDSADIVPGPDAAFTGLPPGLQAADEPPLVPVDVLAGQHARARLSTAIERGEAGLAADQALAALDQWRNRYQSTFGVRVGEVLARAVNDRAAEVRELLTKLDEAARRPEMTSELQRKQRRLALAMRILFAVLLVVLAVLIVLGVRDTIEPLTTLLSCVGAIVVWTGATFALFVAQQRNLFAELHRRRTAASETEINERNLARAVADLRRSTQAYGQFLEWSKALAVVLERPFGDPPARRRTDDLVVAGMPLSTRLGVAHPAEETVTEAVRQLRQDHFRFGWLSGVWDEVLGEAHRRIGNDDLRDDPQRLYGEPSGASFALSRWADSLAGEGIGSGPGEAMWESVLARARQPRDPALRGQALLARVRTSAAGDTVSVEDFLAGVGESNVTGSQQFAREVFGPNARISGQTAVAATWARRVGDGGFGQIAVTVQLSEGMPAYDLAWTPAGLQAGDDEEIVVPYHGPAI
jgi:hypothetical protein